VAQAPAAPAADRSGAGLALSLVLPFGPDESAGQGLIKDLAGLGIAHELILVGIEDRPPPLPQVSALRVSAAAGRARQLNAGAAAARGEWLCFLHADSRLPPDSLRALEALADGPVALRYFDLRFVDGPAAMRLNEIGAHIRSRWLGLPFGDQGLCLPRAWFERIGGFDESLACGEDHALVWAARRAGLPLLPLRAPIHTSARKYAERGWLRTTLMHLRLTGAQARAFSQQPPA
jgi:GT2 family glycosyltransferase